MGLDVGQDKTVQPVDSIGPVPCKVVGRSEAETACHQGIEGVGVAGFQGVGSGAARNLGPGVEVKPYNGKVGTGHVDGVAVIGKPAAAIGIISAGHGV